jgi:hypothetical protein
VGAAAVANTAGAIADWKRGNFSPSPGNPGEGRGEGLPLFDSHSR